MPKDLGYASDYRKQKSQAPQKHLGYASKYHKQKLGSSSSKGYSADYTKHQPLAKGTIKLPTEGGFMLVKPQHGKMYQTNTVASAGPTRSTHVRRQPGTPVAGKSLTVAGGKAKPSMKGKSYGGRDFGPTAHTHMRKQSGTPIVVKKRLAMPPLS